MMQDKIKIEVFDLTGDSDGEQNVKTDTLSPVKESSNQSYSETEESNSVQKLPNGKFVRNIDKCIDKAITEIRKGQSLITVASQYGIPQEVLYSKLVSRSLPKETDILTKAEENSLVKWIVKSNKNNTLIFKQQLMDRVGKLKKVMSITPIFAKSKFGRMWYEYFMKNHPEIYENDGLIMPSNKVLAHRFQKHQAEKNQAPIPDPADYDILTPDEEEILVNWILTANKSNSLIFKFQLMRRVSKTNKIAKSMHGFAKSKFGRIWYERFLKKHPEIYENDELLLPSENMSGSVKCNLWPDEDDIKLSQSRFFGKHPAAQLLSYGIKDAVVVLHDFRKDKNSPYRLNGKNTYVKRDEIDNKTEDSEIDMDVFKNEATIEDICIDFLNSTSDFEGNSGIKSNQPSSSEDEYASHEFEGKRRKRMSMSGGRPVCIKCSRSFCNKAKLKRHLVSVHQPKEYYPMKCLECGKMYASKYHLIVHMRDLHNGSYHECEVCGKQFKFKTSMRKHQRTVHEGLDFETNIFFCDICEKGFKYKNSLEAHIIYGHLKEKKRFSCDICNKSFVRHSLMLRHRTRHSKIKPMSCVHCGKTYSRKYLLREHIQTCAKYRKETSQ